jgi:hypothetical protein
MPRTNRREPAKFLAGWKDVANYLGKGVRTVQRYEREMGLPVRRPAGKPRAAVVATKAELDAWIAASPFRDAFYLPRLARPLAPSDGEVARRVVEMRRLKLQTRELLEELREEVRRTVLLLHESIHSAQDGVNDSRRNRGTFPNADFNSRKSSTLNLVGTRVSGKAN